MGLLRPLGDEVTIHIAVAPAQVWALVSDVTRIGEFSPETFEAEWTGDTSAPAVGSTFRGHVKRNGVGPTYWTHCKVTVCEPEDHFEFAVMVAGPLNRWGYRLQAENHGTRVTEYFRLTPSLPVRAYWTVLGRLRARTNQRGMRTTLERMKAVLENQAGEEAR